MRNFQDDLNFSESDGLRSFWDSHYSSFFGNSANVTRNCADNVAQRRGVDVYVTTGNDHVFRVDEKADTYAPNNFFIEFVSVDNSGAPGWIEKDLAIDYLAYGFINHGTCYFLPWPALKRAWETHKEQWLAEYKQHDISNNGYKTRGIAVPVKVVGQAIMRSLKMDVA